MSGPKRFERSTGTPASTSAPAPSVPASTPSPGASPASPVLSGSNGIGVWGPPDSGKTILLTSALWTLQGNLDKYNVISPFNLERTATDYQGAEEFFKLTAKFGAGGNEGFLENTVIDTAFTVYITYPDSGRGKNGHFHSLSMADIRGEYMRESNHDHSYWQHLRRTRGILFVVDQSERTMQWFIDRRTSYEELINNFIAQMRYAPHPETGRYCDQFLMICVTKADQFVRGPDDASRFHTEDYLKKIIGTVSLERLRKTFKGRLEIALTSAVGWSRDDQGRWQAGAYERRILNRNRLSYQTVYALLRLCDHIEEERIRQFRPLLGWYTRGQRQKNVEILRRFQINNRLPYLP